MPSETTPPTFDPERLRGYFSLCARCGRHEVAGAFCTYCRTAAYDLVDHKHVFGPCPLGPHPDPVYVTRAETEHPRRIEWPEGVAVRIRHHPRATGYAPADDPPIPAWIVPAGAKRGQSAPQRPKVDKVTRPVQIAAFAALV
jgi:hypothetical protein